MSDIDRGLSRSLEHALRFALALFIAACLIPGVHAATAQRSFATPEAAAAALIDAIKAKDETTAFAILGPGSESFVRSGDSVADAAVRERFASAYEQKHTIAQRTASRAVLTVGPDDWPFAFPLVKSGTQWRFDTAAGKKELLARRIGGNELAAISVMLAIVDAQREYASDDRNSDGVREYARAFASSQGKHDGLYWPSAAGEPPSPLGELVTRAAGEGYGNEQGAPYHGYYFRMLTAQGPHAKGGALDYVVRDHMIGGFAVVAYPAQYGNSGVMTFIVNHDGVVYQKNLGPETAKVARAMTRFDPAPGWAPTGAD